MNIFEVRYYIDLEPKQFLSLKEAMDYLDSKYPDNKHRVHGYNDFRFTNDDEIAEYLLNTAGSKLLYWVDKDKAALDYTRFTTHFAIAYIHCVDME